MMKLSVILILLTLGSCGGLDQQENVEQSLNSQTNTIPNSEKTVGEDKEITDPHMVETEEKILLKKEVANTQRVNQYCDKIDKKFNHWGWGKSRCKSYQWHHVRDSFLGTPLIWKVFGDEEAHLVKKKNTTMILCGVHGDEITPIKFCFDVLEFLESQDQVQYKDKLVVVAPIVSPDSFFTRNPSRTNYRGVDVNRNFPTKDWDSKALKLWKSRYKEDKRRYPGDKPLSEHETVFQVNLIKRYAPDKIISVHAPLTILDYDGPMLNVKKDNSKNVAEAEDNESNEEVIQHASTLLLTMSEKAKGYRIKNYPFFPGSLGNYAGNERGIPTYTLELPSSDNRKHKVYWDLFKESIHSAIFHDFRSKEKVAENPKEKKKEAPL